MSIVNNKNIIFFQKMWFSNDLNVCLNVCKRMFSEIMCVSSQKKQNSCLYYKNGTIDCTLQLL